MRRLVLRRSPAGEFVVWKKPQQGSSYIVVADMALAREGHESTDSHAVGVFERLGSRCIEQCAELVTKIPPARVGEIIACLARAYGGRIEDGREHGCAIVNIERNTMDVPHFYLIEQQRFPEVFCFFPKDRKGEQRRVYTAKTWQNAEYLLGHLFEYLDRGGLILHSQTTLNEIAILERLPSGKVPGVTSNNSRVATTGKDRAVMAMLACVTDHELPPPKLEMVDHPQIRTDYRTAGVNPSWMKAVNSKYGKEQRSGTPMVSWGDEDFSG